jgi:CheY-like chemotaxis protein
MYMNTLRSILLVDDDKDDQYFFYKALEEVDSSVDLYAAGDGNEAFEKLRFLRPDLILLDLVMPGMNGVTFLKTIKQQKALSNIPVVVYTTDLSIFREKELLSLGAEKIIYKPEQFTNTVNIIQDLLKMPQMLQSA